jgi:hypothetical protein
MFICMRTTVNLNDELHRRAKEYAARNNRTLTSVIEGALRFILRARPSSAPRRKVKIPTSGSGGVLAGVDLNNLASLLDKMEER